MVTAAIRFAVTSHGRRRGLSWGGSVLAVLVGLTCAATSLAQDRPERSRRGDERRGPSENVAESPTVGPIESESIEFGYVIINDHYLPPPYVVQVSEEAVLINGEKIRDMPPRPESSESSRRRRGGGDQWGIQRLERQLDDVSSLLYSEAVFLVIDGQPLIALSFTRGGIELFRVLTTEGAERQIPQDVLEELPLRVDRAALGAWLSDFVPPPALLRRARADIERFDARAAAGAAEVSASRRLQSLTYPLTVLGMLLTGLAIGHLLLHRPAAGETPDAVDNSPSTLKLVRWSLALVLALSCLDLVWTVLASQAKQMHELNPLGSRLIGDPVALVAFKVAAVCLAVGLIYFLRQYRRAQLASWWACLICTLLTARWLTFNSLFIG